MCQPVNVVFLDKISPCNLYYIFLYFQNVLYKIFRSRQGMNAYRSDLNIHIRVCVCVFKYIYVYINTYINTYTHELVLENVYL